MPTVCPTISWPHLTSAQSLQRSTHQRVCWYPRLLPHECRDVRRKLPSAALGQEHAKPVTRSTTVTKPKFEVRICTNRTCKSQGSQQVLKFAEDLHLEELEVRSCGCLAGCGNGPNMIVLPLEVTLHHVATPAKFAEAMRVVCDVNLDESVLQATQLRLKGNTLARDGNLQGAVDCYTEALELGLASGRHLLYANRAGARLSLGDKQGALEDANSAASCGPPSFTTAYIRQVEAYAALEQYSEAAAVLTWAADREPPFKQTAEYKSMDQQLSKLLRQKRKQRV